MNRLQLETKHYAVIGAFLIGLGTQLSGLAHGWSDAFTPSFIGGLMIQLGTVIGAVLVGSPMKRDPELRQRTSDSQMGVRP